MSDGTIINKVAASPLITFNLEDFLPKKVHVMDLSQWLEQGFILRETKFRNALNNADFTLFEGAVIHLNCSTDAILPAWAPLLVASKLSDAGLTCIWAESEESFYSAYYRERMVQHNWKDYIGKPVIIKGCGDKRIPKDAYVIATQYLKPTAKKISYGEACSAVPLK